VGVDNHGPVPEEIDAILADLLTRTGASRVTLRQNVPGEYAFAVTHEALAPGVDSLRETRPRAWWQPAGWRQLCRRVRESIRREGVDGQT
jgi:hypothetical protein